MKSSGWTTPRTGMLASGSAPPPRSDSCRSGRTSAGRRGRTRRSRARRAGPSRVPCVLWTVVLHARLEHDVAILALPLGAVHRDVGVAQQLLGGRDGRPSRSRCSRSRSRESPCLPSSLNGCLSASSRRSAISSGPAASESSSAIDHELVAAEAPERIGVAHDAARACAATARRSSSPTPWPSVSLTSLKLSRSMNSAATGVWLRRERASICSTRSRINVRFGRPVSASWVARNASSSSRRVSSSSVSLALGLEALAHPQQAELEAQLQDVEGLGEPVRRESSCRGALLTAPRPSRCATRSSARSPRSATPRGGRPARRRSPRSPGRPRPPPPCPRPRSSGRRRSSSSC